MRENKPYWHFKTTKKQFQTDQYSPPKPQGINPQGDDEALAQRREGNLFEDAEYNRTVKRKGSPKGPTNREAPNGET